MAISTKLRKMATAHEMGKLQSANQNQSATIDKLVVDMRGLSAANDALTESLNTAKADIRRLEQQVTDLTTENSSLRNR